MNSDDTLIKEQSEKSLKETVKTNHICYIEYNLSILSLLFVIKGNDFLIQARKNAVKCIFPAMLQKYNKKDFCFGLSVVPKASEGFRSIWRT